MTDVNLELRAEIVGMARDFAQKEIAPHAAEWDRTKTFPVDVIKKLGELGFFGMSVPEEYDGLGLDPLDLGEAQAREQHEDGRHLGGS